MDWTLSNCSFCPNSFIEQNPNSFFRYWFLLCYFSVNRCFWKYLENDKDLLWGASKVFFYLVVPILSNKPNFCSFFKTTWNTLKTNWDLSNIFKCYNPVMGWMNFKISKIRSISFLNGFLKAIWIFCLF